MHTEPAGDIYLDLDITTFSIQASASRQFLFDKDVVLFDEMKFFHLDVAALVPCAMRAVVERL